MKKINRNKIFIVLLSWFVLLLSTKTGVFAFGVSEPPKKVYGSEADSKPYVPGEVIVKFKKDRINLDGSFSLSSELRRLIFTWTKGYETEDTIKSGNLLVLKVKDGQQIDGVIEALSADPNVEYAEPNYYSRLSNLSIDDTYKTSLWGLDNTGQSVVYDSGETSPGTSGADIDMRRAWALSSGTTEVVVAVLDSGVAYNHPDLIGNMWDGTNCKDENGAALGGCVHGYDYVDNDTNPAPSNFYKDTHGTHVAGTIAATRNNTLGIAGVAPNVKIMALKIGYSGLISSTAAIKAIDFAIQNGAKVINASYGGSSYNSSVYDAINRFRTAGGIFVAAAGNEATNNDVGGHSYPSDYDLDNIISVAATDQNDALADFSNYGVTSVDVGAPGTSILSSVNFRKDAIQNFSVPSSLTADVGSSWGLVTLNSGVSALLADVSAGSGNYLNNSNYYITSTDAIDMSAASGNPTQISFTAVCNDAGTTLAGEASGDYMALEVSGDGTSFTEIFRWNEASMPSIIDSSCSGICGAPIYADVNNSYLTSNFKYRFHWVTDSSSGASTGCYVYDVKIIDRPSNGTSAGYDFEQGTSMAAPHVAGLAGYLWSVVPGATVNEIVGSILNGGDTLPALSGKTTTGRRVNAFGSLSLLNVASTGPSITGLSDDAVPAKSKTFTWSSATPSTDQYRYSFDQSISGTPTSSYSLGTTTATYSSGSGTFYIHVQAIDENSAPGPVATASFILDNTGPVATVSTSSLNSFVLSFGETLYTNLGGTLGTGVDLLSRFIGSTGIGISEAVSGNQTITVGVTGTPLAGSSVTLLSGTAANNVYDYLTNAGGTLAVVYDGSGSWWANPTNLNVATTHFSELITNGLVSLTSGSAPETALSMTVGSNLTLTIGSSGSNSSVGLTLGTIISEIGDSAFNATLISGTEVDLATISGLEVGYTASGAIQWGIPGVTLKFSQPILVNIYVGTTFNGQTLNVYRSPSLSVGWTSSGLSSPTCTVSSGYCTFAATEASYYAAAYSSITPSPTPAPTSAPSNNDNNSSSSSSNNGPGAPSCSDRVPLIAPDLFRISTTKGKAKIVYTPVDERITGYAVIYGLKKGDERYAAMISPINNNKGEQSFTVGNLNPKVTYYFKVTAFNGCVSGPWSDWIPAKADRKKEVHKYKTVVKNKVKTLVNQFANIK